MGDEWKLNTVMMGISLILQAVILYVQRLWRDGLVQEEIKIHLLNVLRFQKKRMKQD